MKKIFKQPIKLSLVLSLLLLFGLSACRKDSNERDYAKGAPQITRIRTLVKNDSVLVDHPINLDSTSTYDEVRPMPFDSTTNSGKIFTLYAILGKNLGTTKQLLVNGTPIYFNPALLTDNTIVFGLPETVPFSNATTNNKVTVITQYGQLDYDFVVEQPFPNITSVDFLAGNAGDLITITGTTFDGLSSVKFGTVTAEIVSSTPTKAVVKVPAGLTGAGLISVTTTATLGGGTTKGPQISAARDPHDNVEKVTTAPFGFTQAIYEDGLENGWYNYGWNGKQPDNNNTSKILRGTAAIKMQYAGGYDGLGFGTNTAVPGTSIKFALYTDASYDGKVVSLILNDNFDNAAKVNVVLKGGVWTYYNIPLAFFASATQPTPTNVKSLVFQELSGIASVIYVDDFGVIDLK